MCGAALGTVASAAGTAEAGIVLVTTELGLQDQVTVGKVGLVHALSAQVRNVTHSSCSQAKGEPAVNLSSDCYSLPKDTACSCFFYPPTPVLNLVQHQEGDVEFQDETDTSGEIQEENAVSRERRDYSTYPLGRDSWMVSKVQLQITQPTIWPTNYGILASGSLLHS